MRRWAVFPVLVYCFESHPATNEMLLSWLDVTVEKAWMTCWKLWKLRCTRVVHSGELDIGSIHSKKSIWQYTSVASWYTPWQTKRRQLKQLNANIQSGHSRKPSTECYPMHVVKSRVMCIWKWLKHIKTAWASDRLIFCDLPNLPFIFGIVSCSSVEVSQMSWRFHVRTAGCRLTPWGARAEWFHACAGHVSGCHVPLDQGTMIRSCELCPLRPFHRGFFRTVSPGISRVTSRFYFSLFWFILVTATGTTVIRQSQDHTFCSTKSKPHVIGSWNNETNESEHWYSTMLYNEHTIMKASAWYMIFTHPKNS